MSQYSELMGSFIRTSNFPLEANYIFNSKEELIQFYQDPINQTTLHAGLFKVVLSEDGGQELYWVVKDTLGDLHFEKLLDNASGGDLNDISDKLRKEINARISADTAIWGTVDPTEIDSNLNSILKLSAAIKNYQNNADDTTSNLQESIQAIVGTEEQNIKDYLKTLDYNSLTKISETLHYFLEGIDSDNDSINTWAELQEFLSGFKDTDTLNQVISELSQDILGDPLPTTPFRTLRGIQDFIEELKSYSINRMNNIQTELDQTQVGVGLSGDGSYNADQETYYLREATSVMNALKILDSLINTAINNCNIQGKETESVKLDVVKETNKTTISAKVKLSSELGNDILTKENGLYCNVDSEYENGILTIKVNGNIRQQHNLGLSTIVDNAYYDASNELIVIIFKLQDGNKQTVNIPVTNLIQEWIIDNSNAAKVVELEKVRVTNGPDKLSADVRLSTNKYNILEKDGNTLLVKGIADNIVYDGDVTVKSKLDSLSSHGDSVDTQISDLNSNLLNEIQRAKDAEHLLQDNLDGEITESRRVESELSDKLNSEIERSTNKDTELNTAITNEISRATEVETNLTQDLRDEVQRSTNQDQIHTDDIAELSSNFSDLDTALTDEIARATSSEQALDYKIDNEITRATDAESLLEHRIDDTDSNISDLNDEINQLSQDLTDEVDRAKTAEQELADSIIALETAQEILDNKIETAKNNLETALDSEINRAQTSESVISSRVDALETDVDTNTTDIETLSDKLTEEITRAVNKDTELQTLITTQGSKTENDLNQHITNYNNPHNVTAAQVGLGKVDNTSDLEKPISNATQNALNELNIKVSNKADSGDFLSHVTDTNNPHNVTKEQLGLNNVDNTSDINKPISLATQLALDKKSDIGHTHVMSDITDLENLPIIKGFVTLLAELPESAVGGDKYILATRVGSGSTRYTLCEYDGSDGTWKQKLLTTGGIATVINGDVWKLNSDGLERVLDVSDYTYFYNKIYNETKDLVEDIGWEENDATNDTNNQIRLKITYKTSYGDPNESEVTNPYVAKNVKYIDIEKARFLSNAYARPAIQSDVDNGYATKLGEPMLILILTTGDYVAISLKDALNIYEPIDTSSVDMSVTDWTGNANTSYKVSAVIKLASTKDKETAVSLHILDTTEKGMYATLHTSNTNSISLNPSTGASGTQKTLSANLNINNSLNNNSDVLLTIDTSGLSAKIIWGEYD